MEKHARMVLCLDCAGIHATAFLLRQQCSLTVASELHVAHTAVRIVQSLDGYIEHNNSNYEGLGTRLDDK